MTIHYTLYLAADAGAAAAAEILRPLLEAPPADAPVAAARPGDYWLADGPVSICLWPLTRTPATARDNGVAAKLGVDFLLIAEEVTRAKPIMLRDLLAFLARLPGDAVFHDIADQVVLRRRGGALELNLSCSFWTPELRGLVAEPYKTRHF